MNPGVQITTPAFKAWFAGSKVVDNQGNPLVCFHGTTKDFSEFRTEVNWGPTKKRGTWFGELGSWFTAPFASGVGGEYDQGNAEYQAGSYTQDPNWDWNKPEEEFLPGARVLPVFLAIKNPAVYSGYEHLMEEVYEYKTVPDFRKHLIQQGYDGIKVEDSYTDGNVFRDDWVAFYPNQIKSAIGNKGTYSSQSNHLSENHRLLEAYSEVQTPEQERIEKIYKDFQEVGAQQRGAPESIMLKFQDALSGGVHAYLAEHVGDLSHRASLLTLNGEPMGYEYVIEKVSKALRTLTNPYGFERERLENLQHNAMFRYVQSNPKLKAEQKNWDKRIDKISPDTPQWDQVIHARNAWYYSVYNSPEVKAIAEQMDKKAREIGKEYANAHRKVKTLTTLQTLGKHAAIAIGEYNFPEATRILKRMDDLIKQAKTPDERYDLWYEGYP